MERSSPASALILGTLICAGLGLLGYLGAGAAIDVKQFERSVTVKGLSEREYPADVVIWPIQFVAADNELETLYAGVERSTSEIRAFLEASGIPASEISVGAPSIVDKAAQNYGGPRPELRYSATQTVTVYSERVDTVRPLMAELSQLGKRGIVFTGADYAAQTEYLFTRLNAVKPDMIEEATRNAREVAQKFAQDSDSRLGKIKRASQGQFSISPRDRNNPHIKRVRVVSTVTYYLSD